MEQRTADRLVSLRKNAGYSQEELADLIGVSRQAVSKWERCESSPDTDNLIELARLYHITLDELVTGNELPPKEEPAPEPTEKQADFIWQDDGMTVEVHDDEVSVKNEDGEKKTYDRAELKRKGFKEKRINALITGVFSLAVTIAYLTLGFCLGARGWVCAWPLFLLIPVASSVVEFVFYKRIAGFGYPSFIVAIYCAIGMIFGVWHPTWIMFITIPIFYIVAEKIDRVTRSRDYEAIEDALDGKESRPKA